MSRSRRKNPICGHAKADSEKEAKRMSHKKDRRKLKKALREAKEGNEDANVFVEDEYDMAYDGPKDGKGYYGDLKHEDPDYYDKLMRK